MADFLDILARDAQKTIAEGYYKNPIEGKHNFLCLSESIIEFNRAPVITEIKLASPTLNTIRTSLSVEHTAASMESGGAVGISVLTEPKHFMGSLNNFITVQRRVELPLLMKDVFLSRIQIDAASTIGADVVLLIQALFDRDYCECNLEEMIDYAHSRDVEVLLETHTPNEFAAALDTDADLIGINNRDLRSLNVDINNTKKVLQRVCARDKIVVSESGIKTIADLHFLHKAGAHAFQIGSAIMKADNVKQKVKEFVSTL